MGCVGCNTGIKPAGCNSNGNCGTGGCNILNTYDWLSDIYVPSGQYASDIVEVSFKNGVRKDFFRVADDIIPEKGQLVAVEAMNGHDVGEISLTGLLCQLQMKKKKVNIRKEELKKVYRQATKNDIDKLAKARELEKEALIKARVIARKMNVDIKIGDVEYQGDLKKLTIYFTAEGRVDFRELVKEYARTYKSKIEMRQIGLRQESGKIGGIGSCGRELCCSTWLTDFKSVSTNVARYQNLSINSARLSGQCGRLKCCLNYELDTYAEAFEAFPKNLEFIKTKAGVAKVVKTDILKKIIFFSYKDVQAFIPVSVERVNKMLEDIKNGKEIEAITAEKVEVDKEEKAANLDHSVGHVSLKQLEKKRKNKNFKGKNNKRKSNKNRKKQ